MASSPHVRVPALQAEDQPAIPKSSHTGIPPAANKPSAIEASTISHSSASDRTDELWSKCREILRQTVAEGLWLGYFRHLQALRIDHELAVLVTPSNIIRDRVQRRYLPILQAAFDQLSVRPQSFRLETHPEVIDSVADEALLADQDAIEIAARQEADAMGGTGFWHPASGALPTTTTTGDTKAIKTPNAELNIAEELIGNHAEVPNADVTSLKYTFESFVTGSSNRFAHAATLSVAETPGVTYNPLFIHGQTGLGKTHLLQAIVHYISANLPHHRVRYVSTETFLSEFIEAIRTNSTSAFKRTYRDIDVLLLDDIQFMQGKEGLQEELFHTFNSLHVAGRQIVISSDRPPRNIATLSDRLRSRFEWGLITDIQPPDLETRVAILRKKAEKQHLPEDVLNYIAHVITNNIRELEGALVRVTAYASLTRSPVTLELTRQLLSDANEPEEKIISTDLILRMTADMFGYEVAELVGQRRQQGLVRARQISMYVMRQLTDLSYPAIALIFGGRDHSTVMHSVKKISNLLPSERKVYNQVEQLVARLRAA